MSEQFDTDRYPRWLKNTSFDAGHNSPPMLVLSHIERIEALNAELLNVICLADEIIMEANGAFPLPGNPLRDDCLVVRSYSGNDYHERKRRAALAKATGQ